MAVWVFRENAHILWLRENGVWTSVQGVPVLVPLILIDQKKPGINWYDTTETVFFDGWSGDDCCVPTSTYRNLLVQAGIAEPQ